MNQKLAELGAVVRKEMAELRVEFHREIAGAKAELIRWTFAFWVPVALTVLGLSFKR